MFENTPHNITQHKVSEANFNHKKTAIKDGLLVFFLKISGHSTSHKITPHHQYNIKCPK